MKLAEKWAHDLPEAASVGICPIDASTRQSNTMNEMHNKGLRRIAPFIKISDISVI